MAEFYDDLFFPETIALYTFKGSRLRSTRVAQTNAGFDQRKSNWAKTKRTYDAGLVARPADQWRLIDDFFETAEGQAIGFNLKDPTDYQVDQAHGLLAQQSGDVFSFQKMIIVGSHTAYRAIGKPRLSTLIVYKTNAGVTTTVASSHWSVNTVGDVITDGKLTFATGYRVTGDTFAFATQFYVPARFATDDLDWTSVDKAGTQLLISGPSIPIVEDPQDGLLYIPPT